jgi:hypothetical protein
VTAGRCEPITFRAAAETMRGYALPAIAAGS